jgi:uncharacterized protein
MNRYKGLLMFAAVIAIAAASFFFGRHVGERRLEKTDRRSVGTAEKVPDPEKSVLAIVIDDVGYSRKNFEAIKRTGIPLTLAVLPGHRYSVEASEFAALNGLDVILHLPMEPVSRNWAREKHTLMSGMSEDETEDMLAASLSSTPGTSGVSNHMGSKVTADEKTVNALMRSLKKRELFFLDSLTTPHSICESAAGHYGVPYLRRDVFIDNRPEKDYISGQLMKAGEMALEKGRAIAIGHDRENTIAALKEIAPELKKRGIRFVTLKEMVFDLRRADRPEIR